METSTTSDPPAKKQDTRSDRQIRGGGRPASLGLWRGLVLLVLLVQLFTQLEHLLHVCDLVLSGGGSAAGRGGRWDVSRRRRRCLRLSRGGVGWRRGGLGISGRRRWGCRGIGWRYIGS